MVAEVGWLLNEFLQQLGTLRLEYRCITVRQAVFVKTGRSAFVNHLLWELCRGGADVSRTEDLVLLNDVQYVEAARVLAEHLLKQPGSDGDRIRAAFVRLAGRKPDAREMTVLLQTLKEQRAQFKSDPKLAAKLIAVGDSKADAKLYPVELASMTVAVQTVMNSDAAIWKR